MTPEILAALEQAKRDKRPVVLATQLPSGEQRLLPDPEAPADLNEAAARALDRDESGTVKLGGDRLVPARLQPAAAADRRRRRAYRPGAGAVRRALRLRRHRGRSPPLLRLGRAVSRTSTISTEWPDEALDEFAPDSRTAVVTLTHDPKLDDPALDRALKSQAFYIGALGSRRTHAARLKRLRELGHQDNALSRIRGPVGLNIEAVTAPEIALSIIAEIVAVRRNAPLPPKPTP